MSRADQLARENPKNDIPFQIRPLLGKKGDGYEPLAKPGKVSAFEVIWVSSGSGSVLVDLNRYSIRDNTLCCLAPGQIRQLRAARMEGYLISFTESFLDEEDAGLGQSEYASLVNLFGQQPVLPAGPDLADEIGDLAGKMLKEYGNHYLLRSEMLRGYVHIMLLHIRRQLGPAQPGTVRYPALVQKFIGLLDKHYREKKMVTDYAEALAVSTRYLNDVVKKALGYPPSHLIRQRILLEAKRKAMYSDANMKEVAYSLGFEDIAHFSRFFKNTAGMNFTDFRKNTALPLTGHP